ncbi:MAG: hydroxymethylpyrimidine/phosphomethylpyrimidine kinase [Gammaproteobacteria bacterium]|jgi:hydroxymethylpyrimidine/phosphomethylpyrimidine kinase
MAVPIALTIAGSDSGGGAGIQADLKTFSALGVYGASVLTALTAQNTREVRAILDVDPAFIRAQLETVLDDLRVDAIKIGMLSRPQVIETVAAVLSERVSCPVVLDPVMVAKSGDRLLQAEAVAALRDVLVPLASVITPNLPEAADLLGINEATNEQEMHEVLHALGALGSTCVLLKGGHLVGEQSPDLLLHEGRVERFVAVRHDTTNTHGTGCTLSSAITAQLARGQSMTDAVRAAKQYVSAAIAAADDLGVGSGHGPVHHFYAHWR